MNSINQFIKLIVVFISIITLANGNLITLDGQCDSSELQPSEIGTAEFLNGTYNVVEQTFMGRRNRTGIKMMCNPEGENVNITEIFRSTENNECEKLFMNLEATDQEGVYDVLYQIAPNSDFVKFKGYILGQTTYPNPGGPSDLGTFSFILYLCRDLPDSKHQVELSGLSLLKDLSPSMREDFTLELASNGMLLDLDDSIEPIDQSNPCEFA